MCGDPILSEPETAGEIGDRNFIRQHLDERTSTFMASVTSYIIPLITLQMFNIQQSVNHTCQPVLINSLSTLTHNIFPTVKRILSGWYTTKTATSTALRLQTLVDVVEQHTHREKFYYNKSRQRLNTLHINVVFELFQLNMTGNIIIVASI